MNLKKIIGFCFLISILSISCTSKIDDVERKEEQHLTTFAKSSEPIAEKKDLRLRQTGSTISLFWYDGSNEKLVHEFNNIPNFRNRIYTFPNKSIVGYLPSVNPDTRIIAHNDLNHEFELFYCNSEDGSFHTLGNDRGWNFHIIPAEQSKFRWILNATDEKAELFLLEQNGEVSNGVNFTPTFWPDFVEIKETSSNYAIILFGMLGKEALYKIDFTDKSAELLREEDVETPMPILTRTETKDDDYE